MRILYPFLLLTLAAAVLLEAHHRDGWGTFWLTVALACFVAVKGDLTRSES